MEIEEVDQINKIRDKQLEMLKNKKGKAAEELREMLTNCSHTYMNYARPKSDGSQLKKCTKCHHMIVTPAEQRGEQVDQIDKIRTEFFDKLNKEEEEKRAELEKKKATCSHAYMNCARPKSDGSQLKKCTKCHHMIVTPPEKDVLKKGLCTIC
jgi:hypothetical protein